MFDTSNPEALTQQLTQQFSDCITVGALVQSLADAFRSSDLFYGHGTDNPDDEAYALVFFAAGFDFAQTDEVWDNLPESQLLQSVASLASRRIAKRIPLPYLTGEAWFAGLKFIIDPRALIPRSPFAELIQNQFSPWVDTHGPLRVLDMCTGNGCIGIATSIYLPDSVVDIVDISTDALDVARQNVEYHGVIERVNIIESDLFAELTDQKYDLIVSNPPYVPASSMVNLPVEYRHEPQQALQAEDEGMAIVNQLLNQSADHLNPGGSLIVEVGEIEEAVHERYKQLPFTWLEFEHGGEGVFLLHDADLPQT